MTYTPGLHLLVTAHTPPGSTLLLQHDAWKDFIRAAIDRHGLTEVGASFHDFPGGGFTGIICLTESHISIHTWPEYGLFTYRDWVELCMGQLEKAHPGIARSVTAVDCWIWGHGMVRPVPGFMTAQVAETPSRIHFAHSDLSGISIFEEAFYHGERAAMACMK